MADTPANTGVCPWILIGIPEVPEDKVLLALVLFTDLGKHPGNCWWMG
jgi:hypothetical protein